MQGGFSLLESVEKPEKDVTEEAHEQSPASAYEVVGADIKCTHFHSATALKQYLDDAITTTEKVYLLEGLPLDYVQVFGLHFDLDPGFVDCHARREAYLRKSWHPRRRPSARTASFAYPELVEWESGASEGSWDGQATVIQAVLSEEQRNDTTIMKYATTLQLRSAYSIMSDQPRPRYEGALSSHASVWSRQRDNGTSESESWSMCFRLDMMTDHSSIDST